MTAPLLKLFLDAEFDNMTIRILHIDDEQDVLVKASAVINGTELRGNTLAMIDSCGFDEGMKKLESVTYDLVILDLCIGKASSDADKIGQSVFDLIKEKAFIPVVFFTGLPDYVRDIESDIVKVASKAEGYDSLFEQIEKLFDTGFIQLKAEVETIVKEGLRFYFWNFVHPKSDIINQLKENDVSLKYMLLRRLGRTLSTELTRIAAAEPDFAKTNSHPMEFYIYPPMEGEYEAGDIVRSKETGKFFVLLTPSCDCVVRHDGKRSAEKLLLVEARIFQEVPEVASLYEKLSAVNQQIADLQANGEKVPKNIENQPANLETSIKAWLKPGKNERFFFLPKTPFIPATLIDFQHKLSVSYEDFVGGYDTIASLDDPIAQSVLSNHARYYSRIGYQDLDIEYAFKQLHD